MSRFRHVELQYASRLLNHGPTILITSYDAPSDRRNVMAAAWSMPVEFAPPRVAIVVDKSTWTREIIERNGTFGIVVPASPPPAGPTPSAASAAAMRTNSMLTGSR
jgi:hypothetical protein